ncbi:PolyApolymerase family protein [Alphaproteobacteria bacterium]
MNNKIYPIIYAYPGARQALPEQAILMMSILNTVGKTRLVGGYVRDLMLYSMEERDVEKNIKFKCNQEIDVATELIPEDVMKVLSSHQIRSMLTGIKHGTVTAVLGGQVFEITTLRKDVECDGRWAVVEFGRDWHEDAERRDFTINAMYMDEFGNILDYCDGFNDLKIKLVKFVGNAYERIHEDYLRILRYFRFLAYLGFTDDICSESLDAAVDLALFLKMLAKERIKQEMFKLLTMPFAAQTLHLMREKGVLLHIGLDLSKISKDILQLKFTDSAAINLAVLLVLGKYTFQQLQDLGKEWRLSNAEHDELQSLCFPKVQFSLDVSIEEHKRCIYLLGKNQYICCVRMLNVLEPCQNLGTLLKLAQTWKIPKLPLTGKNLVALGFCGPEVGALLKYAEKMWVQSNFQLSAQDLVETILDDKQKRNPQAQDQAN